MIIICIEFEVILKCGDIVWMYTHSQSTNQNKINLI